LIVSFLLTMVGAMATMPTVKQMQDRAQEHQEVRQNAEDMSRMLGEEIEAGDGQKSKEYEPTAKLKPASRPSRVRVCGVFHYSLHSHGI